MEIYQSQQPIQWSRFEKCAFYVSKYDSACLALLLSGSFALLAHYTQRYKIALSTLGNTLAFGSIIIFNTSLIAGMKKYWQQHSHPALAAKQQHLKDDIQATHDYYSNTFPSLKAEINASYKDDEGISAPLPQLTWDEFCAQVAEMAKLEGSTISIPNMKLKGEEWWEQWKEIETAQRISSMRKDGRISLEIKLQAGTMENLGLPRAKTRIKDNFNAFVACASKVSAALKNKNFSSQQIKELEKFMATATNTNIQSAAQNLGVSADLLQSISEYTSAKSSLLNSLSIIPSLLSEHLTAPEYQNLSSAPVPRFTVCTSKMAMTAMMMTIVWGGVIHLNVPVWPPSQWSTFYLTMMLQFLQVLFMPEI